ncbi:MAG: GNAT family N-acetyltransferase [Bacillota bacterium]|nr:GNAT family N-acetyltransferase [Bacillota bacterium]
MNITFEIASKKDIESLVQLRIAYMVADHGSVSEIEKESMKKQLPDYFSRKLGNELIPFIARFGTKIVGVAYLHIIEMPASPSVPHGLRGEVLNVYVDPDFRRQGIGSRIMSNLVEYARCHELDRIELSATQEGSFLYKKVGFVEKVDKYIPMQIKL